MKYVYLFTFLLFCCATANSFAQADSTIAEPRQITAVDTIQITDYQLSTSGSQLAFSSASPDGLAVLELNREPLELAFRGGRALSPLETDAKGKLLLIRDNGNSYKLFHISERADGGYRLRHIPMWLSVLPPLVAILLALVFREVIVSLFIGVWAGAFIAGGMRAESLYYFMMSFLAVVQEYVINALMDSGHLAIMVFSLLIGGMVAIISRNGGMAGVVEVFSRYARSPRSAQFMAWLLGVAIFFDDYANTLIVGNTMRKVTDRYRISREKLAYIVDSTAAPVAAIAFITTWIGAELGYIDDGIRQLHGFDSGMTPYALFIASLKYAFYPVLTLSFMLMLIFLKRDFGGMRQAELRARNTGEVSQKRGETQEKDIEDFEPVKGAPLKWYNAAIPVALVIIGTIFGLIDTGMANIYAELLEGGFQVNSQGWSDIWHSMPQLTGEGSSFFVRVGKLIGSSDSYTALLWASLSGVTAAVLLTIGGRIMGLADTISTMITGFKSMLPALLILTMAWSLAATTGALHTATFLATALQDSVNPYALPVIIFILAALISFSTGSSWSTMAILYPIAIPTTWAICLAQGIEPDVRMELLLNVIAVTLGASVLGDHCSPISDTTILSSLASDCNHIDHVRTQMPYALTVGAVSITAGGLSTLLGGGWGISALLLLGSLGILLLIVRKVGAPIPHD